MRQLPTFLALVLAVALVSVVLASAAPQATSITSAQPAPNPAPAVSPAVASPSAAPVADQAPATGLPTATAAPAASTPSTAAPATPQAALPPVADEVAADPALLNAVGRWEASAGGIGNSSAPGGWETALNDCRSGKVNFAVTQGWCYATDLKLYYNARTKVYRSPLTGETFTYDKSQPGKPVLRVHEPANENEEENEPAAFRTPPGKTPPPLSTTCTPDQRALIAQHIQGLQKNASRTDSPPMRQLFTFQAQWWQNLCN